MPLKITKAEWSCIEEIRLVLLTFEIFIEKIKSDNLFGTFSFLISTSFWFS